MKFEPTMEVVRFGSSDVIAASVVLSKFNDGDRYNNTFSFNGKSYIISDNDSFKTFRSDLADYVGDSGLNNQGSNDIHFNGKQVTGIFQSNRSDVDGVYTYDGTGTYSFTKKTWYFIKCIYYAAGFDLNWRHF